MFLYSLYNIVLSMSTLICNYFYIFVLTYSKRCCIVKSQ
nr:MAG TPA: hypothetical protein [Caudoviricetes sp.]